MQKFCEHTRFLEVNLMEKPIVLVIMDGVGKGDGGSGDAVAVAKTPTLDNLLATCPHTYLLPKEASDTWLLPENSSSRSWPQEGAYYCLPGRPMQWLHILLLPPVFRLHPSQVL